MEPKVIDFNQHTTKGRLIGYVLLAAGLAAAAWTLYGYRHAVDEIARAQMHLEQLQAAHRRERGSAMQGQARPPLDEIRRVNLVINALGFPWDKLFAELELCADTSIALLTIQPDAHEGHVRIGGEAKTLVALVDYTKRLERTSLLTQVYIQNHEIKAIDSQRPVIFSVVASWKDKS